MAHLATQLNWIVGDVLVTDSGPFRFEGQSIGKLFFRHIFSGHVYNFSPKDINYLVAIGHWQQLVLTTL